MQREKGSPSAPAWRTVAAIWDEPGLDGLSPRTVERARPLDTHLQPNSEAEYIFYHLHGRFQRYAEEYLFVNERILAFVPWTAATTESWRRRVGRWLAPGGRRATEGALIVTDGSSRSRQQPQPGKPRRCWQDFSPGSLTGGCGCLAGSCRASGRSLRTRGARNRRRPGVAGELGDIPNRASLETAMAQALRDHPDSSGAPRRVRFSTYLPAVGLDHPEQAAALTQEHLVLIAAGIPAAPVVQTLAEVTSAELRRSVLGFTISLRAGAAANGPRCLTITFPTLALDQCLAGFATIRQALALLPVEAAGADLPLEPNDERVDGE